MNTIAASLYSQGLGQYLTDTGTDDLYSCLRGQSNGASAGGTYFKSKTEIRKDVDAAMSLVEAGKSGKKTLADVTATRDKRLAAFKDKVSAGLLALGINPKTDFTLGANPSNGKLIVQSSSPDKRKIQAYFDAHPALSDEFGKIQKLDALAGTVGKIGSKAQTAKDLLAQLNPAGLSRSIAVRFDDAKAKILSGIDAKA